MGEIAKLVEQKKGFNEIELPAFSNYDLHLTVDVNLGFGKGQISYSGRNLKKVSTRDGGSDPSWSPLGK